MSAQCLTVPLATRLGVMPIPKTARSQARALGVAHYAEHEALEWCHPHGPVAVEAYPSWLPDGHDWLPLAALRDLGLRLVDGQDRRPRRELVITAGVDSHADDQAGLLLLLALHNTDQKLIQGRNRVCLQPGEWAVFDDRKPHAMSDTEGHESFVGLVCPVDLL